MTGVSADSGAPGPAPDLSHSQPTDCLLCGHPTTLVLNEIRDLRFGVPGVFEIRQCNSCGLEQTAPILAPEELSQTYERYYNFRQQNTGSYGRWRQQLIHLGLYRFWIRLDGDISFVLRPGHGRRLLDVGCNEGRNLMLYGASGFETEGLETNPTAAAIAKKYGYPVHLGELKDLELTGKRYDVVVLSNVLEHVSDPVEMLNSARNRIEPGGEVWVSCPNAQSIARHWFGRSWINWHPPFHLLHFTANSLVSLLRETGFGIIDVTTISPALWMAQSLVARRYARPGVSTLEMRNPRIMAPLLVAIRGVLFPVLWRVNRRGRGDCLLVRARKPLESGSSDRTPPDPDLIPQESRSPSPQPGLHG